jgi:hypothetical protein
MGMPTQTKPSVLMISRNKVSSETMQPKVERCGCDSIRGESQRVPPPERSGKKNLTFMQSEIHVQFRLEGMFEVSKDLQGRGSVLLRKLEKYLE